FPGLSRAIYSWIPLKERGIITGINFSGSRLGAAFALPMVAYLIDRLGWRASFAVLGGIGALWAIVWYVAFRDDPADHPAISEEERDFILQNRQQSTKQEEEGPRLSFSDALKSSTVWYTMLQYFCSNFTFFFALTWLFPHLKSTYNLESVEAGWYASLPLLMGAVGNWFAGWWVDDLYKKGKWNLSRRLPAIIGFACAAIGLVGSVFQDSPLPAVLFLSLAIFGADMTLPPSWSLCVDIGKRNSGMVSGTMNMAGNVGSFITALAFPYLAAWTGNYDWFFYVGAGLNLLAIFLWMQIRANKPLAKIQV
ncbi:MAG: MFS transporter, partial [Bacteroidota bacterium]